MRRCWLNTDRHLQPLGQAVNRTLTFRGRAARIAALAATGGFLFQAVGCATGLTPVFLSFVESALLSLLLGGLAFP